MVVVPFLALGGMFALIALTGTPSEGPLAAPPPSRPSSQWWTEPFETGVSLATVTETVVVQGAAREALAARVATQTRVVGGATVTETVRVSSVKPAATGRNEPAEPEEEPPSASSPVVTTTTVVVSTVEPAPPAEVPVSTAVPPVEAPATEVPPSSTPRAEEPVPPVTTSPAEPPCDRAEPPSSEEDGGGVEETASPAEDIATSSAPSAGV